MAENIRRPSHAVPPGVKYPNWDAISSRYAHDALFATLALYDPLCDRSGFAPEEDNVRQARLLLYLGSGKAPNRSVLGHASGMLEATLKCVIADLRDHDFVVLDRDGDSIVGAYRFTDGTTEHRIVIDGREINAMCAIDALGAGAMARRDSVILSQCREYHIPLRIVTAAGGTMTKDAQPADPIIWIGRHYRDNFAAGSLCKTMCFFCSEGHLDAWCTTRVHLEGFRLSMVEGLEVKRALFEPPLSETAAMSVST